MNIQEQIKALETEFNAKIKDLKAQVEQEEQEFPQDGYEFWFITSSGDVARMFWHADLGQEQSLSIGNVFKTSEEAEFAVEKLKVEAELRKFSKAFELWESNYLIALDTRSNELDIKNMTTFNMQGAIHFESAEKAQQAIESVGEDRIKKYIFGVED